MIGGTLRLFYSNVAGAVLGIYYVWGFQRNCRDSKAGFVRSAYSPVCASDHHRPCNNFICTFAPWESLSAFSVASNAVAVIFQGGWYATTRHAISGLAICSLTRGNALFFSGLMSSLSSIVSATSLCSTLPKAPFVWNLC